MAENGSFLLAIDILTLERSDANCRKRVLMPNVCEAFGIVYADTFAMLRDLGAGFRWP